MPVPFPLYIGLPFVVSLNREAVQLHLKHLKDLSRCDRLAFVISCAMVLISCVDIVHYILLAQPVALVSMLAVNVIFILCALAAFSGRLHPLYLVVAVLSCVLFSMTNYPGTTPLNFTFAIQAALSVVGAVGGTALCIADRERPKKIVTPFLAAALALAVAWASVWGMATALDKGKTAASQNLWAVPAVFDGEECPRPGTLERIDYATRAYATDGREVQKSAYVYLPHGYSEGERYNILYLLHGTGDDETYWFKKFSYNKTMVDNLIYRGEIEPLIIVTPTFYVEDDCMDDLDQLTYSFKEELRNDLMPAVESRYSTYAVRCDEEGFTASRDHRAFAGLSRGAVTTLHSAFAGSLDYFSAFGTFSGSRTPLEYFRETIQSDAFKDYPIAYWYVASGAFDFGLNSQANDYNALLPNEPRLVSGVNTSFDVYPMRYHSMGNWHLALYNFLQRIF